MHQPACWTLLATLPLLATPSFAEDQIFSECTGEWFRVIRQSTEYAQFIKGGLDTKDVAELDLSKLALVAAFSSSEHLGTSFDVVLKYSNKYTAAVLYACLEGYMGNPSQAAYRYEQFQKAHPCGSGFELEAAFFAHIRDEPSFRTYVGPHEVLPFRSHEKTVEVNMYSSFAQKLVRRSQPYMSHEWQRLSEFTQNDTVKTAARSGLSDGRARKPVSIQTREEEFATLAEAIRGLYRRACRKTIVVYQRTTHALPGPYEHFSIRLGDVTRGQVQVAILDPNNKEVQDKSMRQDQRRPLPRVVEGSYELQLVRLVNYPIGIDYGVFSITPVYPPDTP